MKKLLFSAVDMNIGGIETALLTLLNELIQKDYDITLVLEKKQGIFLNDLDPKIKVIEYKPNNSSIFLIRKFINLIKRIKFTYCYKNKFDFSASFATYSKMASFVARTASTNNVLWGHNDYLELYKHDKEKVREFFESVHFKEFKKIIFVSKKGCETFLEVYPKENNKVMYCNNLIDYKKIQKLAEEKISEEKEKYTFVNVGRHDENQKRLIRILEATKRLKDDNMNFQVWFIGEGKDTNKYIDYAKENDIEKYVKFLGKKKNPYPYMKKADCVVLSSDYEGYPVVFVETFVLNKPIITTDVADAIDDIQNKFGKVVKKSSDELYKAMKEFIEEGYSIKEHFNPKKFNEEVLQKIEGLIEGNMIE